MHRNVTRLVPRTRRSALREATLYSRQCRNYSFFDRVNPFSRSPSKDSEEATNTTTATTVANDDVKNPVEISLVDRDPEELKRLLQQLDQKALVDTKTKLQELRVRIEGLRTSVPGLFPKTMALDTETPRSKNKPKKKKDNEKGGGSSGKDAASSSLPPYILAHNRTLLADLPTPLTRATTQISHLIAHISDLQTEDYRPGDRLAGWKEEISAMSKGQKEEKLMELQYEEEAMMARMVAEARKNLGLVEGLVGVARQGVGERERSDEVGKTEGRAGRRERERQKQREKGEGKRGERERVLRIGQSRAEAEERGKSEVGKKEEGEEARTGQRVLKIGASRAKAEEGKGEGAGAGTGEKRKAGEEKSLSELQARLHADFNRPAS